MTTTDSIKRDWVSSKERLSWVLHEPKKDWLRRYKYLNKKEKPHANQ